MASEISIQKLILLYLYILKMLNFSELNLSNISIILKKNVFSTEKKTMSYKLKSSFTQH